MSLDVCLNGIILNQKLSNIWSANPSATSNAVRLTGLKSAMVFGIIFNTQIPSRLIDFSSNFAKMFFDFEFAFLSKRGGGLAALRRFGSAPGPKTPSCVSAFVSKVVCRVSVVSL